VAKASSPPRGRRAAALDERPPAPWGSFPLVELVVLVAIVMLVGGLVVQGGRGPVMIAVGLVLGALAGTELSIREHFAGYRSHTLLLSGGAAVAVLASLAFLVPSLWLGVALAAAVAVFALTAWALTRVFRRRSGQAFKVR
jgi:FtsH-binding integral membrane protein